MSSKPRLKVVGYPRVSTEEQAKEGVSLDAQRGKIELYCELHDLDLIGFEADPGFSGKSLERPGVRRVLTLLDTGAADGVVVTKLDRLTRSVKDFCWLVDRYFGQDGTKKLLSIGDSIDTRTAIGRLMLTFGVAIAQWERETICERTQEGMDQKRRQGEYLGGPVPFGFGVALTIDATKVLVSCDRENRILGRMLLWRAEGETIRGIAARLNEEGVPTRNGGPWSPSTIQRILERITPEPQSENHASHTASEAG